MTDTSTVQRDETAERPSGTVDLDPEQLDLKELDPGELLAWSEQVAAAVVDREVETAISKLLADGACSEFEQTVIRELAESIARDVVVERVRLAIQESDSQLDDPESPRQYRRLWSLFGRLAVETEVRPLQPTDAVRTTTTVGQSASTDAETVETAACDDGTDAHQTDTDTSK